MIGYKAFDKDLCCNGFQFKVGETYDTDAKTADMKLCTNTVFHFCRELSQIENVSDYVLSKSRICEVISGDFITDQDRILYGTNRLTILREIIGSEKYALITANKHYTGDYNAGDNNAGHRNTGDNNAGHRNTGDCNTGDYNAGDYNTGDNNTGHRNTGDRNTGHNNTGNRNTGHRNTGDRNTGDNNTGDNNTGNWNIGDNNTGNWNISDGNSGFFNTDTPPIRMFNKYTSVPINKINFPNFLKFALTGWITEESATEKEKLEHKQEIAAMGGFLKKLEYKEAFWLSWRRADISEHKKLLALPNWDNEIFKEISGIDAEAEIAKEEADENQQ